LYVDFKFPNIISEVIVQHWMVLAASFTCHLWLQWNWYVREWKARLMACRDCSRKVKLYQLLYWEATSLTFAQKNVFYSFQSLSLCGKYSDHYIWVHVIDRPYLIDSFNDFNLLKPSGNFTYHQV
jgi:hypothetical protein